MGENQVKSSSIYHQKSVRSPLKVRQNPISLIKLLNVSHIEDLLSPVLEASRYSNASSCLNLVTGEHPDLDAGRAQGLDGEGDLVLKLILNTCNSQQLHADLEFADHLRHLFLSIDKGGLGCLVSREPLIVVILSQTFLCND